MHRVRVRQADVFLRPVRTRMPFRYGKAVVTEEPIAHLRIVAEIDGHRAQGVSAAARGANPNDSAGAASSASGSRSSLPLPGL